MARYGQGGRVVEEEFEVLNKVTASKERIYARHKFDVKITHTEDNTVRARAQLR